MPAEQVQNDTMAASSSPPCRCFFDRRLPRPATRPVFICWNRSAIARCKGARAGRGHLGISRPAAHPHPFGGDVLGRLPGLAAIATRIGLDAAQILEWTAEPITPRCSGRLESERGAFTPRSARTISTPGVLLPIWRCRGRRSALRSTVAAMERELCARSTYALRQRGRFRHAVTAFLICRFWLIDALWSLGRASRARLFTDALQHPQPLWPALRGRRPADRRAVGQFPQTYSMAGLILSAMRLSRSWETLLAAERRVRL